MDDLETSGGGNGNDEDLSLPKGMDFNEATMSKLIQELLPPDITCAKDTKDLLTDCCVEFIHLVSSEGS